MSSKPTTSAETAEVRPDTPQASKGLTKAPPRPQDTPKADATPEAPAAPPRKGKGKGKGTGKAPATEPETISVKDGTERLPDGRIVPRRVHRMRQTLRCKMTDAERLAKADELARAHQEVEAEQDRQAEIKSDLKTRLTRLEATRTELANVVASGHEWRTVTVVETHSFLKKTVEKVRTDTGELIESRAMTDVEAQIPLPIKEKTKDAAKKD